ncbi:MAG: hypothetical protein QOE70_6257 [Chthoniobacter sp.]|nr:hypothetical protein [Chthoniobacter sp.]
MLISGAARGIGQAIAIELATAGADIIGVDLRLADLEETGLAVEKSGRRFERFACDVADETAARALLARLVGFNILVNNAGVLASGPFAEGDFAVWRRILEVNLLGTMVLTHAALPAFVARGRGHIVNIASTSGKFALPGFAAYGASKHALVGFSAALRAELAGSGVGVSCICPSFVNTRMTDGAPERLPFPLRRRPPQVVARAVRRAIETDAAEVFVPSLARLTFSIIPALFPAAVRRLLLRSVARHGWLKVRKGLTA